MLLTNKQLDSRARQMRLPTSYKPALTHRPNPIPARPRNLLTSPPLRPPSPDDDAHAHAATTAPSSPSRRRHHRLTTTDTNTPPTTRPKHPITFPPAPRSNASAAPTARDRDPSPTRSAASQPASSTAARASLWAELKDIRRRSRTPAAP